MQEPMGFCVIRHSAAQLSPTPTLSVCHKYASPHEAREGGHAARIPISSNK